MRVAKKRYAGYYWVRSAKRKRSRTRTKANW